MFHPQSLSMDSSRTWFGLFCLVVVGFLAITVASAMGENTERSLLLIAVLGVFLTSGCLLGLLAAYQVCQTHLPKEAVEAVTTPVISQVEAVNETFPRAGLKGLLAGSESAIQSKGRQVNLPGRMK